MGNVAVVQGIYDAFRTGDLPGIFGAMHPDIEWNEAENYPYAVTNPHIGPEAILAGVFGQIAGDWDGFAAKPDQILDAGDHVVALGRYSGVAKATGTAMDAQFAHVWRLVDGKVASFQQYADTLQTARALGR
ncbi:MAG: nuclear transport factor 2 family protein [Sphingomonas sp.]|jgi:hypothetical protein|uniref:nuclear transport factor 2 family protein n=1 Tax=Sphingomonas sp. TaxID=28214 RepID=UPI003565F924